MFPRQFKGPSLLLVALLCHQGAPSPVGPLSPANRCDGSSCSAPLESAYMTFEQMERFLKDHNSSHPNMDLVKLGETHEKRAIWLVKIQPRSSGGDEEQVEREAVWVEGGLHAREWISGATSLHLIEKLTKECEEHCDKVFYIAPMANPDGYEFSRTQNRLWRKNRAPNPGSNCVGVDLNRNWNVSWGVGASNNPCSNVYMGSVPFSEPETRLLSNKMKEVKNLRLVVSLHSFGQTVLYPYGFDAPAPDNKEDLIAVGRAFSDNVNRRSGKQYEVKNSGAGLYYASGATDDWALKFLPAEYVYTVELRDQGVNGFELPASQIAPVSEEVFSGLHAMLDEVRSIDLRK